MKNENKEILDVLKEYREFGTDKTHKWEMYSSSTARDEIIKAYKYFPSDWIEKSIADSEKTPISIYIKNRGSYSRSSDGVGILINYFEYTSAHELAHRMEDIIPDIVRLEKEFYERRTAGEDLVSIKKLFPDRAYGEDEMARLDKFNHPYMGKDYGGSAYEIFSMGVEKIFFGRYNEKADLDYDSFIIGLLLGVR